MCEMFDAADLLLDARRDAGQNFEETAKQFHVATHANKVARQVNASRAGKLVICLGKIAIGNFAPSEALRSGKF